MCGGFLGGVHENFVPVVLHTVSACRITVNYIWFTPRGRGFDYLHADYRPFMKSLNYHTQVEDGDNGKIISQNHLKKTVPMGRKRIVLARRSEPGRP